MYKILIASIVLTIVTACGTNPVTGKRQITLMSQSQEIALGQQQYAPSQQSQGGTYTVDPNLSVYVNRIGQRLAKRSAQPTLPYEFVVLNNDVPNAWALPGGKIAINRGLLVLLEDEAQLAAVLGHEVVHAAARHGAEQMATGTGLQLLATLAMTQTDNQLYRQAAGLGAAGAQAHYGRENELESDHYGINYMVAEGYDPYGAVELQQTFLRISKESGRKSDFFSALFASHPPSQERVDKNRARAKTLPAGKRNRQAFLNATRQIRKDKPAYEKHQAAMKAAGKKQWGAALSLTEQAIRMQPREARFHVTKGRLLNREKDYKKAQAAFDRAVTLEPNYFAPHLYRGLLFNQIKNYDRAQKDFLASSKLLPNQPAHFYLGEIAHRKKDYKQAAGYYKKAVQGGGEMGKTASSRLQRLGIR
ncbi:MAG: M48 family metalloprotease [Cellvibrionaceae bacterium]